MLQNVSVSLLINILGLYFAGWEIEPKSHEKKTIRARESNVRPHLALDLRFCILALQTMG